MKKLICFLMFIFLLTVPVSAEGAVEIYTPEDLAAIANDPAGSYILMKDLDMTGVDWHCFDFSGTLDGNGHGILNLTLTEIGETVDVTLDGNQKPYDTRLAGMFGKLDHAEIKDLKLMNLRGLIECDEPCFLGGIAGFSDDAVITNCDITASLELRAHDRMFGVAGVLGYGTGTIEKCDLDVTLICVDTDASTRDEQFLGGAFGTGFMTVKNCSITIDGYISEHGYVHSGGVTGMLMQYPVGMHRESRIMENHIYGKITFFEDNTNRRAYCEPTVGEQLMNYNYGILNNQWDFKRDERKEYDVELRPEMCAEPVYNENVVVGECVRYGYTEHQCTVCGYTYRDQYTLPEHTVPSWQTVVEPTTDSTGLSKGRCTECGAMVEREEEMLPPATEPETQPESDNIGKTAEKNQSEGFFSNSANLKAMLIAGVFVALLAAIILAVLLIRIIRG